MKQEKQPRSKEQIEADITEIQASIIKNEEFLKKEKEKLMQQGEKFGYNEEEMAKLLTGETITENIKTTGTEVETPPAVKIEEVVVENDPKTLKISKQEKKKAKNASVVKDTNTTNKKVNSDQANVNATTKDIKKDETTPNIKMGDTIEFSGENLDTMTLVSKGGDKDPTKDIAPLTQGIEPVSSHASQEDNKLITELDKKIEDTREKYIKEYNKCKKEADKEKLIDKTRNSVFNILAGVKNLFSKKKMEYKKEVKVGDYFTKEATDAKKEYDKTRIEMGEAMYNQKKSELEKAGLTGAELETALTQYKATEILAKTIIDERQKIIDAKKEGLPIKPALWKRAIDAYMKIKPRWKRVALSTLIFLPISATGALGASAIAAGGVYAGIAGLAGLKFGASMAIGAGVGHLAKGIDWAKKGADLKFKENQDQERLNLENEFSTGKIDVTEYEKGVELLENEEKKRARNRMLLKAGTGGLLALGAGYGSYTAMGLGVEHISNSVDNGVDAITGPDISHTPSGTTIEHIKTPSVLDPSRPPLTSAGTNPESSFKVKYPFPIKTPEADNLPPGTHGVLKLHENIVHSNVEATALHGKGAIATLRELQHNLKVEYGNDLNNAPASVKHILNTDAHKLAEEYGMYKPGQDAESAFIKSGSSFKVDGHGNVTYHEVGVKTDINLEKGTEVKVNTEYEGKMIDSDHSEIETNNDSVGSLQDQYKLPPQVNPVAGEPVVDGVPHNLDQNITPPAENLVGGKHMVFENDDGVVSIKDNGSSLKMQFIYDKDGKIIDVDVAGRANNIGPNPYTLEGELGKLGKFDQLDANVDIFKMTSKARFLDLLPKDTLEYKFLSQEVANMQKEIINNYGNVLNPKKLVNVSLVDNPTENLNIDNNLTPELLEKVNQTYTKNIEHLFPDKKIEFWNEIKDSYSVEKLMGVNKEGGLADVYKPLASHITKLEEISGLKPVTETLITKAESIPHFIMRAEEAIAKMGKLDEIKL